MTNWQKYIKYLQEWALNHRGEQYEGCSPACYDEFCDDDACYEDFGDNGTTKTKPITVKELIKALQAFNPDAVVMAIPPSNLEDDRYLNVMDAEQEFSDLVTLGLAIPEE